MQREHLGSRLGFILLSAGCAIGCGNVWKFPWLTGENGGGIFVLIYLFFLFSLGLPVMVMEFALGRASQASPVLLYDRLARPGQKWHLHGKLCLAANLLIMMFYTSVAGWILCFFFGFLSGGMTGLSDGASAALFGAMQANPGAMVGFMGAVVVLGFAVLSLGLRSGVEKITKVIMVALLMLMLVLAGHNLTLPGAKEGLAFYLLPDFSRITVDTVVAAMNQAFFTLSLGIGSMAIFGSYIGRERSLMGESVNILLLDTFVALVAGLIIFPACFSFQVKPDSGPSLLFVTMAKVFNGMEGGQWWGALFFLFMFFAAMSTVIAVFENILAMVRDLTGWSRRRACLICCIGVFLLSLPSALGYNLWSGFVPFREGTRFLDLFDFLVSNLALPLGSVCYILFCTSRYGWGFDNFLAEANMGQGLKFPRWLRPYVSYVLPAIILMLFVFGILTFEFAGTASEPFTLWGWLQGLFAG